MKIAYFVIALFMLSVLNTSILQEMMSLPPKILIYMMKVEIEAFQLQFIILQKEKIFL